MNVFTLTKVQVDDLVPPHKEQEVFWDFVYRLRKCRFMLDPIGDSLIIYDSTANKDLFYILDDIDFCTIVMDNNSELGLRIPILKPHNWPTRWPDPNELRRFCLCK